MPGHAAPVLLVTGASRGIGAATARLAAERGWDLALKYARDAAATLGSPGMYLDYAASKGAVDSATIGMARELAAEGVRVNAVRPGIIATEIHADSGDAGRAQAAAGIIPMHRPGQAAEVAEAIVWLLSPAASYTTGAIVDVSGGR